MRKIDELISRFNCKVADMDISRECRFELLGMITAIGMACKKELNTEPEQPEVLSDGTLHITVDLDISKISRILLSQKGTHYGNLFYVDDAEPERKKGSFIGTEYDGYADGNPVYYEWKCSECGCIFEDEEPTFNFCPNCGADMRGIKDGCSNIESKDKI